MKLPFLYKFVALLVLVAAIRARAEGDQNAFAGTWKLNVEKSHFGEAHLLPREETVTVVPGGKTTIQGISDDGKPFMYSYPFSDGKPVPFNERKNVMVTEKVSGDVMDRTITVDGNVVSKQRGQISKDGKTGTFKVDSTDGQGRHFPEVYFYDKQ